MSTLINDPQIKRVLDKFKNFNNKNFVNLIKNAKKDIALKNNLLLFCVPIIYKVLHIKENKNIYSDKFQYLFLCLYDIILNYEDKENIKFTEYIKKNLISNLQKYNKQQQQQYKKVIYINAELKFEPASEFDKYKNIIYTAITKKNILSNEEKSVLFLKYNLADKENIKPFPFNLIAIKLKISYYKARKIHNQALNKLKYFLLSTE